MNLVSAYEKFRTRAARSDVHLIREGDFDDNGIYAYQFRTGKDEKGAIHFVFCYKGSSKPDFGDVASNIVSCHETLINYCHNKGYAIIFQVKDRIFSLKAQEILNSQPFTNERPDKKGKMVNFVINACNAKELNSAGIWMPIKSIERTNLELFPQAVGGSGYHA